MIQAYGMFYGFYFDPTYILLIIGMILCLAASARVKSTFAKYNNVRAMSGLTGYETAMRILRSQGITDVQVGHVKGNLTDHYNPTTKTLNLSDATYNSTSVAAISVAAHECGHVMQHAYGYVPIRLRASLVPFANWGARLSWLLIFVGIFINSASSQTIINLGIFAFSLAVLFQLVTLPVEFNASKRALMLLESIGILGSQEISPARKVLSAAALTYVAAAASSILQLLRLVILFGNRGNNRR